MLTKVQEKFIKTVYRNVSFYSRKAEELGLDMEHIDFYVCY